MLFLDVKFCLKIEMPSNNNLIKNIKPNIYIYIYIYIKRKRKKKIKKETGSPFFLSFFNLFNFDDILCKF
jgi:spore coat polysaccharide biosynthesis predicted glycosyltransferase SpsG